MIVRLRLPRSARGGAHDGANEGEIAAQLFHLERGPHLAGLAGSVLRFSSGAALRARHGVPPSPLNPAGSFEPAPTVSIDRPLEAKGNARAALGGAAEEAAKLLFGGWLQPDYGGSDFLSGSAGTAKT